MVKSNFKPILFKKKINIYQIIKKAVPALADRFLYLDRRESEIAIAALKRHFQACSRLRIKPDITAIEEIIEDAESFRAVYKENDYLTKNITSNVRKLYQKRYQAAWKQRPQNRLKLRKYYNSYRQKNLEVIRRRQRDAYRKKHNLAPEDFRFKLHEAKFFN